MNVYVGLEQALSEAGERVDRSKQNLYYCDVDLRKHSRSSLRHDLQASVYVLLSAALERFLTTMMCSLMDEINSRNIRLCELRPTLFAVANGGHFLALQDVRGLKMWNKRNLLLAAYQSNEVAQLSSAHIPVDGGTIRFNHVETFWQIFGLQGSAMPDLRSKLALSTLADNRNLVAHGESSTSVVAGSQSIEDALRLVERIETLVLHIYSMSVDYLDDARYLR